jgi:hypothetical protein
MSWKMQTRRRLVEDVQRAPGVALEAPARSFTRCASPDSVVADCPSVMPRPTSSSVQLARATSTGSKNANACSTVSDSTSWMFFPCTDLSVSRL